MKRIDSSSRSIASLITALSLFAGIASCAESPDWKTRIAQLERLDAIKQECLKYDAELNASEPVIMVGRDTTVAPLYYSVILYPPLERDQLREIENNYNLSIPHQYKEVLLQVNGAFLYHISLYGIPSTFLEKEQINRSALEPLNLVTANENWISEVGVSPDNFLFGSSHYNDSLNIHYCLKKNKVVGYLNGGATVKVWESIDQMLAEEIKRMDGE